MTVNTEKSREAWTLVARSDDVAEGGRQVIELGNDVQIGLFRFKGKLYAYENLCPHQGGPACQGRMVDGVRERIEEGGRSAGLAFDKDDPHIVCPWHGFEYRLTTGEHAGVPSIRLRGFGVREEGGDIHVAL
ncbi:Rieske 2Fe-2S domain-containing protein [Streptomyces sp. NPDC044780]|uniref:Rieske (2Fe-2S) protein n=1 Tax=unclassified Streptomyces TaxID=2593676 RepID=UPI0033E8BFBF